MPEWRVVLEPSGALLATGNDTQISFPFSDPGYYRATVAVHDEVSGRIVLEKSAGVAAYWAREGEARISPGVSERHRLVDVPLSGDNLHALFRLHVEGDPPTMDPINQGRFLLVDALGGEHETHSTWPSDVQATNWPGPYRLEWESGRPIDTPVNVSAWAVFWRALDSGPSPVCTSLPC